MFASVLDSDIYFPNPQSMSCSTKTSSQSCDDFELVEYIFYFINKCIHEDPRSRIYNPKKHILSILADFDFEISNKKHKILNNLIKKSLLSMNSKINRIENLEFLSNTWRLSPRARLGAIADVLALLILRGRQILDDRRSILIILKLLLKFSLIPNESPDNSKKMYPARRDPLFMTRQAPKMQNSDILRNLENVKKLTQEMCNFVNLKTENTRTILKNQLRNSNLKLDKFASKCSKLLFSRNRLQMQSTGSTVEIKLKNCSRMQTDEYTNQNIIFRDTKNYRKNRAKIRNQMQDEGICRPVSSQSPIYPSRQRNLQLFRTINNLAALKKTKKINKPKIHITRYQVIPGSRDSQIEIADLAKSPRVRCKPLRKKRVHQTLTKVQRLESKKIDFFLGRSSEHGQSPGAAGRAHRQKLRKCDSAPGRHRDGHAGEVVHQIHQKAELGGHEARNEPSALQIHRESLEASVSVGSL